MEKTPTIEWMTTEQDRRITQVVEGEKSRLQNFIRKRVADEADAEDILQDVFYEFVAAYRLMKPIEQVGAWLFRVARNRIIDLYRKKKDDLLSDEPAAVEDGELLKLEDLLRNLLLAELDDALEELPEAQREVFIAHEIEGRSFKELAVESGLNVNTLLSRKHLAVIHLRRRLRAIYSELNTRRGQK